MLTCSCPDGDELYPENKGHRRGRLADRILNMSISHLSSAGDFSAIFSFLLEINKRGNETQKFTRCSGK